MRVFPILTALVVVAVLYLLVFERDWLRALAGVEQTAEAQDSAADQADGSAQVAVVAMRSEARIVESAVLLRGRTEAARAVEVRAETAGRVVSQPLKRGTQVSAGTVLCAIDPGTRVAMLSEAQARLSEAEARLAEAEISDRAARALSQGGFASETRVAGAEAATRAALAGVEAARAGLAAAQTEIGRLTVTAPFAGLLETDTAELGSLLQPGALCAEVIALDPIKLVGFVPETEVERIVLGAPVGARLASGREIIGRVSFLSRSADETTRTFRVEAEVPNPDLEIRDGQTVEIAVAAEGERAHLIPASALTLDDAGRLGVRITEAGAARFVAVTLLRDTTEGVWLAGLPDPAEVIVVGQEYVVDGTPVAVTLRGTTP